MQRFPHKTRGGHGRPRGAFFFLLCTLFLLSSLYGYFAYAVGLNAVQLRDKTSATRVATSALSELETRYLSEKRAVTLSLAYRDGFEDARSVVFITRKALGVLSGSNEI